MDVKNWYSHLPANLKQDVKLDKNYKKHFILPKSMMVVIGGTGSGKSNAIIDMIHRMQKFYEIIIFNPVSTDEPLYQMLKQEMPDVQLIDNIEDLPELKSFDSDKDLEKLLIVDDFINLPKKDMKKINEYFTGGRKSGFTVVAMCQNYTSVPKIITRNAQYFIVFKLNDNVTINNIIKNHNVNNIPKEDFKGMYLDATAKPLDFLLVDLKGKRETHLRRGFLHMYDV